MTTTTAEQEILPAGSGADSQRRRRHPCGPQIRKYCRQANRWLPRERRLATLPPGIDPPLTVSDDLHSP